MGHSTVTVEELEPVWGVVPFARRALGVEALGINWFELPPGGEGKEHDETDSQQEEVSLVIEGSGIWRVDGREVQAGRGTIVRFDPETTAQAVAGRDGISFPAIGARRGSYEPRGELF